MGPGGLGISTFSNLSHPITWDKGDPEAQEKTPVWGQKHPSFFLRVCPPRMPSAFWVGPESQGLGGFRVLFSKSLPLIRDRLSWHSLPKAIVIHFSLFQGMLHGCSWLSLNPPSQSPWGLKEAELHPLRAKLIGGTDTDLKRALVCVN